MKRYIFIVLLIFLEITPAYGKEYRSSFGFTIDIPTHWLVLTRQELKENPDLFDFDKKEFGNIDKDLLKSIVNVIRSGQVECFFNQVTSDIHFSDNINVMKQIGKTPENNAQLREVCDSLPDQLSSYFGRKIAIHQCNLKDINGRKFLFLEFDGVIEGTRSIQYQMQKSPGVQIIITATCKNSVIDMIREELERIILSIKM